MMCKAGVGLGDSLSSCDNFSLNMKTLHQYRYGTLTLKYHTYLIKIDIQ
jgi:hypothetical protein